MAGKAHDCVEARGPVRPAGGNAADRGFQADSLLLEVNRAADAIVIKTNKRISHCNKNFFKDKFFIKQLVTKMPINEFRITKYCFKL